jgi:hypothetical protein
MKHGLKPLPEPLLLVAVVLELLEVVVECI